MAEPLSHTQFECGFESRRRYVGIAQSQRAAAWARIARERSSSTILARVKVGDMIACHALKADGRVYRRWRTTVECIDAHCVVTYSPAGSQSEDVNKGVRTLPLAMRGFYWLNKPYNLFETHDALGTLVELYANVASVPTLSSNELSFVDYELDLRWVAGGPVQLLDEDEFAAAILTYGYSEAHQRACRAAAEEARALLTSWTSRGEWTHGV